MRNKSLLLRGAAAAVFATYAFGAVAAPAFAELETKFKLAPEFEDGDRAFKVRGRLMIDGAHVDAEDFGEDTYFRTEARRARLGVEGKDGKVKYKFEVSFEGNEIVIEDALVEISGSAASLILGQWKTPQSLNEQTSSRHIDSMERAGFTDAFDFGRAVGIGIATGGDNYTFTAGVFGDNLENSNDVGDDEMIQAAARLTFTPINANGTILHVGGSARYRDAQDDGDFRYRQRPQVHIADRYIATGSDYDSDLFVGVEAAFISGPFHVAGEYGLLQANGDGAPDADLDGYYVEGGYFLTGESRGYKKGAFDRNKPANPITKGGMGAWELRGRYDVIDLSDVSGAGEQKSYTAGVNWYATDYLKFMAEFVHAEINDGPSGDGDVDAIQFRTQIDW